MTADALELGGLIARVAHRDRKAFSTLYERTSRRVFAVAFKILDNRAEAEDATQEIYLKIWRQAATFDERHGAASAWVNSLARNHSIDLRRARKPSSSSLDDQFDLASPDANPEDLAVGTGERALIDACMKRLPPDRAAAVRQAYIEGHSYEELAEIYEVPVNTMRTWLRRSLIVLRDCLSAGGS